MDDDSNGLVTLEEWRSFIKDRHAEKGKKKKEKGDAWLASFLHTLEQGYLAGTTLTPKHIDLLEEQARPLFQEIALRQRVVTNARLSQALGHAVEAETWVHTLPRMHASHAPTTISQCLI